LSNKNAKNTAMAVIVLAGHFIARELAVAAG
jgi:hypothetical protein